ncbi:MAG TPA: immunoglobulin domain-containing protein, partial [Verrucomicrobiae bacterium]|nr:immunoglobulin domain-containing protein [Verrucomicrobiae bacterium]
YLQDVNPSGTSWCAPSTGHRNQLTNDFYIVTNSSSSSVSIVTSNLFSLPNFTSSDLTNSWGPSAKFLTWKVGTTNWGVKYAGWSFLTNVSFYDYRESKTVQAVEIVVSNLDAWITNNGVNGGSNWNYALTADNGRGIDSVYVYNSVPMTSSQLPAVRVIGGAQLPYSLVVISGTTYTNDGLTIATPQPMYVAGDYNVRLATDAAGSRPGASNMAHTYPAAILADAVTVLSDSWEDSYNSATFLTARTPTSTAITAAVIEGIVPSSTNYPQVGGVTGYSGGLENFLRLLEDWSGSISLTYNGSIAVLFPSQYATNFWQTTGHYYNAPVRVWSFDTNFENSALLPVLTPDLINSNIAPAITIEPTNEIALWDERTNFVVAATGVPAVSYQWSFDGTNISGATNAVLTLADLQATNAGNYTVQVTNVFGSLVSSNATLSLYPSPVPAVNGISFSATNGMTFYVAGVPGFNYAVEASTNLVDWQTLITNLSPFSFLDTNATNLPRQFYRVVYLP